MAWRDQLREASFRGILFECTSHERELGRNVAWHDFPFRDFGQGEDLGLKAGDISIDAFIIGDDYMTARDAFEKALNTAGTGVLITPWHGQTTVRLMAARARETSKELGMVWYQLGFRPETSAPLPAASIDTGVKANAAADTLQTQAGTAFVAKFNASSKPNFVADEAAAVIGKLSDQFDSLTAPLKAESTALAGYVAQGQKLRADVLTLVTKPLSLASQISGLIQGIRTIAATPADALNVLKGLLSFGSSLAPVHGSTSGRVTQADNQAALVSYVRASAAAEAVRAVADIDFVAYQDAIATRDGLAELIDAAETAEGDGGNVETWKALGAARRAMVQDVNARGGSLARLYTYTPPVTMPAVVLAYKLYDDTSRLEERYDDIVARNRITHPGFVRGGLPLEVLSDT